MTEGEGAAVARCSRFSVLHDGPSPSPFAADLRVIPRIPSPPALRGGGGMPQAEGGPAVPDQIRYAVASGLQPPSDTP